MAAPILLSAAHDNVDNLVDVAFDQAMETRGGDHCVLSPEHWELLDGAGVAVLGLEILAVEPTPADATGALYRITFTGAELADGVPYVAHAGTGIWSTGGDPVAGPGTAVFLGEALDAPPLVVLPSLYLGRVTGGVYETTPLLLNETPEDGYPWADLSPWITCEVHHTTGISLPDLVLVVDGETAYSGGVQPGWEALETTLADGYRIQLRAAAPFLSGQEVLVQAEVVPLGAGDTLATSWEFRILDADPPAIVEVVGHDLRSVEVALTRAVVADDPTAGNDALNPDNWTLEPVPVLQDDRYIPAHPVTVTEVVQITPARFMLTTARGDYMTPDGTYTVKGANVEDLTYPAPNEIDDTDGVDFQVPGRDPHWNLWYAAMREEDRRKDAQSGDLRKMIGICQDVADLTLGMVDRFYFLNDPALAPEEWLDELLGDMGNPFADLVTDVGKKRVLALLLLQFYQLQGTAEGIEAVVRFVFDLDPVTVIPFWPTTMILGQVGGDAGEGDGSELGEDWVLGPSGAWALYSFNLEVPRQLTVDEKRQIRQVVNWMKQEREHFMDFVEPEVPEDVDHWELGLSDLDVNTDLH